MTLIVLYTLRKQSEGQQGLVGCGLIEVCWTHCVTNIEPRGALTCSMRWKPRGMTCKSRSLKVAVYHENILTFNINQGLYLIER